MCQMYSYKPSFTLSEASRVEARALRRGKKGNIGVPHRRGPSTSRPVKDRQRTYNASSVTGVPGRR